VRGHGTYSCGVTRAVNTILLVSTLLVAFVDGATAPDRRARRGPHRRAESAGAVSKRGLRLVPAANPEASQRSTGRQSTRRGSSSAAKPPETVREQPPMQCPSTLGNGVSTQRLYCDVLSGPDPGAGLRVTLPAHTGPLTLSFTLHNRQTYSESEVKAGKAFARYTASVRAVGPDGAVLGHAVVQSEFRTAKDVVERIGGGAGPGGVKAVAPTGAERVTLTLPEKLPSVTLIGEKLTIERLGGTEVVTAPGRPVALVSQVEVEYRPARTTRPKTR
jgi:hypothetical protein